MIALRHPKDMWMVLVVCWALTFTLSAHAKRGGYDQTTSLSESEQLRYCVPPSLLAHDLNSKMLLKKLLPWLSKHEAHTITYRQYYQIVSGKWARPERAILLSIDDVLSSRIQKQFFAMVEGVHAHDFVATLGVLTKADGMTPLPSVETLRQWESWGFELANHTITHPNFDVLIGRLMRASRDDVRDGFYNQLKYEINTGADHLHGIAKGEPSVAFITPSGRPYVGTERFHIMRDVLASQAGIVFVVGFQDLNTNAGQRSRYGKTRGVVLAHDPEPIDKPRFVNRVGVQKTLSATIREIVCWYRNAPACYWMHEELQRQFGYRC